MWLADLFDGLGNGYTLGDAINVANLNHMCETTCARIDKEMPDMIGRDAERAYNKGDELAFYEIDKGAFSDDDEFTNDFRKVKDDKSKVVDVKSVKQKKEKQKSIVKNEIVKLDPKEPIIKEFTGHDNPETKLAIMAISVMSKKFTQADAEKMFEKDLKNRFEDLMNNINGKDSHLYDDKEKFTLIFNSVAYNSLMYTNHSIYYTDKSTEMDIAKLLKRWRRKIIEFGKSDGKDYHMDDLTSLDNYLYDFIVNESNEEDMDKINIKVIESKLTSMNLLNDIDKNSWDITANGFGTYELEIMRSDGHIDSFEIEIVDNKIYIEVFYADPSNPTSIAGSNMKLIANDAWYPCIYSEIHGSAPVGYISPEIRFVMVDKTSFDKKLSYKKREKMSSIIDRIQTDEDIWKNLTEYQSKIFMVYKFKNPSNFELKCKDLKIRYAKNKLMIIKGGEVKESYDMAA